MLQLAACVGAANRPARAVRRVGAALDWIASRPATLLHHSPTLRFTIEIAAAAAVLAGIGALWLDLDKREEDRINAAWTLVAAAKGAQGNIGLSTALEALAARGASLAKIQAPGSYLVNLDLKGADLMEANLSGAILWQANLAEAILWQANLSKAKLLWADLSEATLNEADLSGADLSWADLSGATLSKAILSGADLSVATLSRRTDLSEACGDEETKLPPGITLSPCR